MSTSPTPIQSIASPLVDSQFYETPYIYVKTIIQAYLASSPPTGPTGEYNDVVKSDGDSDFFARRAVNMLNFTDMNSQAFITGLGNSALGSYYGLDAPLAPEKLYTLGADIPFQLQQTNGLINTSVAFLTFPGGTNTLVNVASPMFQGVKRRNGAPDNKPNYRYKEENYSYVLKFNQDWTYLIAPYTTLVPNGPRTFVKTVLNWDFELQAIEFSADFDNNNSGQTTYNGYMVKLYDANSYALMKDWVHYRYLSYNGGYTGAVSAATPGNTQPWHPNAYPCPPVLYPKGSNITIDILSLLDTNTTGGGSSIPQTIHFRGVNRIPC
jgi:hypothetical protein